MVLARLPGAQATPTDFRTGIANLWKPGNYLTHDLGFQQGGDRRMWIFTATGQGRNNFQISGPGRYLFGARWGLEAVCGLRCPPGFDLLDG